jgi:hypothetical protein
VVTPVPPRRPPQVRASPPRPAATVRDATRGLHGICLTGPQRLAYFFGLSVPNDAIKPLRVTILASRADLLPDLLESLVNRDVRRLAVSVVANFAASGFSTLKLGEINMLKLPTEQVMSEQTPCICALLNVLRTLSPGPIPGDRCDEVRRLLQRCWHELKGAYETSMAPGKVIRAKELHWDPPYLSFIIERHGGTVLGSSRAELHEWVINLKSGTASCTQGWYRQLRPISQRLDVKPIVATTCEAVRQAS